MKIILIAVRTILILLSVGVLLLWVVANASGHDIPNKTQITFLTTFVILVLISIFLKRIP